MIHKKIYLLLIPALAAAALTCTDASADAYVMQTNTSTIAQASGSNTSKSLEEIYSGYSVYSDTISFLRKYNSQYPEFTRLFSIGKSLQGRELDVLKIGNGEHKIFINAAHHPREYLTTILVLNQIAMIANSYSNNMIMDGFRVRDLLDNVSIYFMPLVNPDGVEICRNINSSWYYNARNVNLNRNYDAEWAASPPNFEYDGVTNAGGEAPFSEPETLAIKQFCEQMNFDASIAYHCAGEIIYWYFNQDYQDTVRDYNLASVLSEATGYPLVGMESSLYDVGRGGGFKDWVISSLKKPSFTIEVGKGSIRRPLPYSAYAAVWEQNKYVPFHLSRSILSLQASDPSPVKLVSRGSFLQNNGIVMLNDRAYVPINKLNGILGVKTGEWSLEAVESGKKLSFIDNSSTVLVNGQPAAINGPVVSQDGIAYIPLRSVCELLGFKVEWEQNSETIYISK